MLPADFAPKNYDELIAPMKGHVLASGVVMGQGQADPSAPPPAPRATTPPPATGELICLETENESAAVRAAALLFCGMSGLISATPSCHPGRSEAESRGPIVQVYGLMNGVLG